MSADSLAVSEGLVMLLCSILLSLGFLISDAAGLQGADASAIPFSCSTPNPSAYMTHRAGSVPTASLLFSALYASSGELAYRGLERSDAEGPEPALCVMQALAFAVPQERGIAQVSASCTPVASLGYCLVIPTTLKFASCVLLWKLHVTLLNLVHME